MIDFLVEEGRTGRWACVMAQERTGEEHNAAELHKDNELWISPEIEDILACGASIWRGFSKLAQSFGKPETWCMVLTRIIRHTAITWKLQQYAGGRFWCL